MLRPPVSRRLVVVAAVVAAASVACVADAETRLDTRPAVAAHAGAAKARTLFTVRGDVVDVAQDRGQVAWIQYNRFDASLVLAAIDGRRRVSFPLRQTGTAFTGFALAAGRIVAARFEGPCGLSECYIRILTAGRGDRRATELGYVFCDPSGDGPPPACDWWPMSGDGPTLAYYSLCTVLGFARNQLDRPLTDDLRRGTTFCEAEVSEVRRVVGRSTVALPRAGGDVASSPWDARVVQYLAASGTRLAVAQRSRHVFVLNTGDGTRISEFRPYRAIQAMALSAEHVVVLIPRKRRAFALEIHRTRDGQLERTVYLPRGTVRSVSISGSAVVFSVVSSSSKYAIWMLDAGSGHMSVLARTAKGPTGLSIEGRRVLWAERGRRTSAIRAITVR